VLGGVAYRKVPAAAGIQQQFSRPGGEAGSAGGRNQVEYFPAFLLDIKKRNAVNGAPVARLPSSFRIKNSPVQNKRGSVPIKGTEFHNPGGVGFAAVIIIIITPGFYHRIEITRKH
jgi:hypothetical protein